MIPWCLIVDGKHPAQLNMIRDIEFFDKVVTKDLKGFLRIYDWQEPAVTIGYHQRSFKTYKRDLNIPVLKRPTGGGAVLHLHDITYSLSTPAMGRFSKDIGQTHAEISKAFAAALNRCGMDAEINDAGYAYSEVCFARSAPLEIMINNKKIMGSAQLRSKGYLLEQGVIPLHVDNELVMDVFGPGIKTCRAGLMDIDPGFKVETFIQGLKDAFASDMGIVLFEYEKDGV